jgi:hypothetical protein
VVVIVVGGGGKDAIIVATINHHHQRHWLNPTNTTANNDCYCRCHTVNNNDRQKPVAIGCRQRQQWQSLLMEAGVDGGRGNGGIHQWGLSLTEAVMGWRVDVLSS